MGGDECGEGGHGFAEFEARAVDAPGDEVFGGAVAGEGFTVAGAPDQAGGQDDLRFFIQHVAEVYGVRDEAGAGLEEVEGVGVGHRVRPET